ncbi:MAG: dihydroorotase family protein [Anaerolineae bacterium]|nr:dihydroorotase family protein [Anaerolineae bacterium]
MSQNYDLLVKNVRVVRPNTDSIETMDVAIKDGKFAQIAPNIAESEASDIYDGQGLLGFPGAIDPHTHVGIYVPAHDDAPTESAAAASGGVTVLIPYVRTGSLYLNMGGSLRDFWTALMKESEGRYYVDFAFHVSPITGEQRGEMEFLLTECGAPNYGEVFMFYGIHGLHGKSDTQSKWLMLNEGDHYDIAHFDFICREAARLQEKYPNLADLIQVSWHCETPEILRAYETQIRREGKLQGLEAYSAARPPHSEAIAIQMVGAMAHAARLRQVNILHITSREAMEATLIAREMYPHIKFGIEVTAGHLLLDTTCHMGAYAKVNPPIRPPEHREYLWEKVLDGTVEWLMTDHANCPKDIKVDPNDPDAIWNAKAGFGGTEYLLPGIFSEGTKRGLSPKRVAELVSWNAAQRFGLSNKGDIAEGFDADLVLLDPDENWTIRAEESFSTQGYTPFEGIDVTGRVKTTFVRGNRIFDNGEIVGAMIGEYQSRSQ